jgi:hypothetical protein
MSIRRQSSLSHQLLARLSPEGFSPPQPNLEHVELELSRVLPRYFLHLRFREGPDGLAVDEEGDEVSEPSLLRGHVEATARDLMRNARLDAICNWHDCTFEVTDEAGQHVLTLPFSQVQSGREAAPDRGR